MLVQNSLHPGKSVWAGRRMKSLGFEVAHLSMTAIDSFCEPLSSVLQFLTVQYTSMILIQDW